jgi:hypothetical protein
MVTIHVAFDFPANTRLNLYDMQVRLVLDKTFSKRSIKLDVISL